MKETEELGLRNKIKILCDDLEASTEYDDLEACIHGNKEVTMDTEMWLSWCLERSDFTGAAEAQPGGGGFQR